MHRKDSFDADAERYLSDGEGFLRTASLSGNNNTFIRLEALLVTFDDLHKYANGVADAKVNNLFLLTLFNSLYKTHRYPPRMISFYQSKAPVKNAYPQLSILLFQAGRA